jgi:ketosteroid isomerase-like protein
MGRMSTQQAVADQIRAIEDQRYQAMTDGDVATLGPLLAADLLYTHSDATTDSKQSYLDRLASGYFKYGPIRHPETALVVHGDCVLVSGAMRGEVQIGGQPRVLNSAVLSVWVREGDGWVLLAFQPTKFPS